MSQRSCLAQSTNHHMTKSKCHLVVTAAIALACSPALKADSFTLRMYESKTDLADCTEPGKATAYGAAYGGYAKQLAEAGILRGGTALPGNAETKTVTLTQGKAQKTDKLFETSDLELGGYFIIEVPDQAAAVEWAKQGPGLASGAIEVKRHFSNATMSSK